MEVGLVQQIDIDNEMRESYLSYAMSVIVSRALPDARDGLKPVQWRILYAMADMGLRPNTSHKKSARVVGEVLGKYHPHGDQSVYDAMVRMAQDFSMRYPLVDGQGNFGSIDGDSAAAMRYTEARLTQMGFDLMADIDKNTVDFGTNFDDSLKEPLVLPSSIPNFLVNGSYGIAVGMSTSMPPHNMGEVVAGLTYMIDQWNNLDDVNVGKLMEFIKGPDFPTGGIIFSHRDDSDALTKAYATGRGRVTVRAKVHVESMERNKTRLVVTELPYQVNKSNLLSRIAALHQDGKVEGLTDLRDESDRNGMRIVLETTRTVEPEDVLAQLFKYTPMESTFSIIMVALVDGMPRVLTLKQTLRIYIEHRLEVVRRRSEFDLAKAKDRAHVVEGLLIALDNLDEVISTIRRSRTTESARNNLVKKFKLTERQANAILDLQLRRLAALERRKIQDEHKELLATIAQLETLLSRQDLMLSVVRKELLAVAEQYVDHRRTQIVADDKATVFTADDLIPDQTVWVMIGEEGTIGRTTSRTMPQIPVKPNELPQLVLEANTRDTIYFFAANGDAVGMPVHELPQATSLGEGKHWTRLCGFTKRNHLADAVIVPPGMAANANGYLFLTTLGGEVKRIRLEDLPGTKLEPFSVMRVGKEDALGWVRFTSGHDEIALATAYGQLIRFSEDDVRDMGLPAGGVSGIKFKDVADGVVGMDVIAAGMAGSELEKVALVWSITDNGLAKASPLDMYPTQKRYGQGVVNVKLPKDAEQVVGVTIGDENMELIVKTSTGSAKRFKLGGAVSGSRPIRPRPLFKAGPRTRITGVIRLTSRPSAEEEPEALKQLSLIS
jgi:DNA gyrase subunit A